MTKDCFGIAIETLSTDLSLPLLANKSSDRNGDTIHEGTERFNQASSNGGLVVRY